MAPEQQRADIAARDLTTTVRYAGASGDFNPLHFDPSAAARAGFDRVLVHGGWLAAHVEQRLSRGGAHRSFTARFERPVRIGDAMVLEWTRNDSGIDAVLSAAGEQKLSARLAEQSSAPDRPEDFEPVGVPYRWCVEAGALRDFVAATAADAASDERQSAPVMPLAFLGNAARWTPASTSIVRRLGFAYERLLHGSTTFELFGPPPALYETLWVTEAFANRVERQHRSGGTMRLADTVHEIAGEDGALRARVINRFVERPKGPQ